MNFLLTEFFPGLDRSFALSHASLGLCSACVLQQMWIEVTIGDRTHSGTLCGFMAGFTAYWY